MDVRGQGALEYLLLIGGAVLVAAIVIALISGMPGSLSAEDRTYCQSYFDFAGCNSAPAPPSGNGECCALQSDGVTPATGTTNFNSCVWDAVAGTGGIC